MLLADVEFESFIGWLGFFDENIEEAKDILMESLVEVPLIERLMLIYNNAAESGADEHMLRRNRDIVSSLLALHQLEKGVAPPWTKH